MRFIVLIAVILLSSCSRFDGRIIEKGDHCVGNSSAIDAGGKEIILENTSRDKKLKFTVICNANKNTVTTWFYELEPGEQRKIGCSCWKFSSEQAKADTFDYEITGQREVN